MSRKFFLLKNFNNNFVVKKDKKKISKILKEILKENTPTIKSLSNKYENSYKKKQLLENYWYGRICTWDSSNI